MLALDLIQNHTIHAAGNVLSGCVEAAITIKATEIY